MQPQPLGCGRDPRCAAGVDAVVARDDHAGGHRRGGEFPCAWLEERVARQFEDLLQRLLDEGWSESDVLLGKIHGKIAFLKRQATLSPSIGVRTLQMMGQLPRYMQYARGLGSLRIDLLLGRETQ